MTKIRKRLLILLSAVILTILCVLLLFPAGKWRVTESGSNIAGISVRLKETAFDAEKPYITVEWHNETEEAFSYGSRFDVVRLNDGKWESCATGPIYFTSVEKLLFNKEAETYYIGGFDLTKPGTYRFLFYGEQIWIEFERG